MSDAGVSPNEGRSDFATVLSAYYAAFRQSHPDATGVVVSIKLTNGEVHEFKGLRIQRAPWAVDTVMIQGLEGPFGAALVVREGLIYRAEFFVERPEKDQFGF